MKQEIKPATGRLGVLVVGVGGAVATTMIVGTLASRKGLAKPIGSITQLATMRMENNEEKLIKDVVPLTDLNDIVFGGCERKRPEWSKRRVGSYQTDAGCFRSQLGKTSERYTREEGRYPLGNGRTTSSGYPRLQGC